jgi:hypothetical protein
VDDDAAEASTNAQSSSQAHKRSTNDDNSNHLGTVQEGAEPDAKKPRLSGAQRKKLAKEEQKKKRGANKGRKFPRAHDQLELCRSFASGKECQHGKQYVNQLEALYLLDQDVVDADSLMMLNTISNSSQPMFIFQSSTN